MNRLYKRFTGVTLLETYTYTASGKPSTRTDSAGSINWNYDARDRVITNTTPIGKLGYAYDSNGNLASLKSTNASGVSLTYQYDALNRLTNVLDNFTGGNITNVFDSVGNLLNVKFPNGITNQYAYDSLNRLTKMSAGLRGAQRGDFTYSLRSGGTRSTLVDNVNSAARTFNWYYDSLYHLTNETVSGATMGTLTNFYDGVGNRTSRTGNLGGLSGTSSTFDVNDWVDNDSNPSNPNLWFDANGNMKTNGSAAYGYDWANRLVAYTNSTTTNGIIYDALGNRIKKITPTGTTVYLVAEINPTGYPQVVEESTVTSGTTNLNKVYTYGLARISQRQISGNVVTFYGYDGLGSVRYLTDTSRTIQNTYAYDAFGNAIVSNAPVSNVYLFAGEQFDPDLKLSYNRARYWDPSIGGFLTMDSLDGSKEAPVTLHKYLYCQADPMNGLDPSGHEDVMSTMDTIQMGLSMSSSPLGGLAAAFTMHQSGALSDNSKEQVPDPSDPKLEANRNSVLIINSQKSVEAMFRQPELLNVDKSVVTPTGVPVKGLGNRIQWTPAEGTAMALGQAPFCVTTKTFKSKSEQEGPSDHFFSAVTMGGHPLEGWRFWRVYRVSGGIVVETGAVDKPSRFFPTIGNAVLGAKTSALRVWSGLMRDALQFGGGSQGTGSFDHINGDYVPDRKQEFLQLVQ